MTFKRFIIKRAKSVNQNDTKKEIRKATKVAQVEKKKKIRKELKRTDLANMKKIRNEICRHVDAIIVQLIFLRGYKEERKVLPMGSLEVVYRRIRGIKVLVQRIHTGDCLEEQMIRCQSLLYFVEVLQGEKNLDAGDLAFGLKQLRKIKVLNIMSQTRLKALDCNTSTHSEEK